MSHKKIISWQRYRSQTDTCCNTLIMSSNLFRSCRCISSTAIGQFRGQQRQYSVRPSLCVSASCGFDCILIWTASGWTSRRTFRISLADAAGGVHKLDVLSFFTRAGESECKYKFSHFFMLLIFDWFLGSKKSHFYERRITIIFTSRKPLYRRA